MTDHAFKNGAVRWIDSRLPVFSILYHSTSGYPTPKNLNYWWNFGSLALFMLVVMVLTGIFLAMNYTPESTMAFNSVERIMRDVDYGWLLRYMHANGASFFFFVVYVHIFRGLYYGSYKAPRELLWWLGLIIYILMMATAFMGYVLPWGQMSFWGATVITNLFSAIPWVGNAITTWLWGGFAVGNPTLNRFFSLHYLLPFVIFAVVGLHLWALHTSKSSNPLGIDPKGPQDTIPFHPYYTVKDLFGVGILVCVYAFFVFFAPNFFGEPDNYIPANPLVTPNHIVPEWYLVAFYAMLRSIPNKLAGVLVLAAALLILFLVPFLDTSRVRSGKFRPVYKQFFFLFLIDFGVLIYVGMQEVSDTMVVIGRVATAYYFLFFLVIMPLLGWFEKTKPLPISISAPVLKPENAQVKKQEKA